MGIYNCRLGLATDNFSQSAADGRRGVSEIGLVTRGADGLVRIAPVWLRDNGFTDARADLDRLVSSRSPRTVSEPSSR